MEFLEAAMGEQNHYIYEFGPFRLDAQKRLLRRDGEPVKLFPKEFDTLLALVEQSGEVLDKDELMRKVWGETIVEESNLTSNISHLRKALGETRDQHEYIVTVPGQGYRFVAGVKQAFDEVIVRERTSAKIIVEEETDETSAQDEADSISQAGNAGQNGKSVSRNASSSTLLASSSEKRAIAEPATGRHQRTRVIAVATLAVALAAFGLYRFINSRHSRNRQAVPFREMKMTRLTNSGRATSVVISPDGKYVVHVMEETEGQSLWVRQVATASNVQIVPPSRVTYKGLTFSRDGNYVYCVRWEGDKAEAELLQVPVLGGPARKLPVDSNTAIGFLPTVNASPLSSIQQVPTGYREKLS